MQGYENAGRQVGWLMSLQVIPADRRVKLAPREEVGSMGKPSLGGGWGQPSGFRTRSLELGLTLTLALALTDHPGVIQDSRVRILIQTGLSKKELFFSRDRSWLQIHDLASLLVLLFSVLASLSGRLFSRRGVGRGRAGWWPASLGFHPTPSAIPGTTLGSLPIFQSNGVSLALTGGHVSFLSQSLWSKRGCSSLIGQTWSYAPPYSWGWRWIYPRQFTFGKSRCQQKNGVRSMMLDKQT